MTIKEKKHLIQRDIDTLNTLLAQSEGSTYVIRLDHKRRLIKELSKYSEKNDHDEIIVDDHDCFITLSECAFEIDLSEGDYYRERNNK